MFGSFILLEFWLMLTNPNKNRFSPSPILTILSSEYLGWVSVYGSWHGRVPCVIDHCAHKCVGYLTIG